MRPPGRGRGVPSIATLEIRRAVAVIERGDEVDGLSFVARTRRC
jgi:hypothetical protein